MTDGELWFQPDGAVLRDVRTKVRELAAGMGAASSICDNLALVVDELVNNAIEHGASYRKTGVDLGVKLRPDGDSFVIEFFDPEMPPELVAELADALASTSNGMPSLDSERGRGLFLLTVYLEELRAAPAARGGIAIWVSRCSEVALPGCARGRSSVDARARASSLRRRLRVRQVGMLRLVVASRPPGAELPTTGGALLLACMWSRLGCRWR